MPDSGGPSTGALVIAWHALGDVDVAACTQLPPPGDAVNSGRPPKATVQLPELAALRSNFHKLPCRSPAYTKSVVMSPFTSDSVTGPKPLPALMLLAVQLDACETPDVSILCTKPSDRRTMNRTAHPRELR